MQQSANYYRFRISPEFAIAIGAQVKKPGEHFIGEHRELLAGHCDRDEMSPYERLIGDAVKGDPSLFSSQANVEEAWRIVTPVLGDRTSLYPYEAGSWGPDQGRVLAPHGGWNGPRPAADYARCP